MDSVSQNFQHIMTKLETCTHVALIAVCCIAGYVLLDRHLSYSRRDSPQHASLVGKRVTLPENAHQPASATVLVAFATTCHYCRESIDLYKQITERARRVRGEVRVVFMSLQTPTEVTKYLHENGVDPEAVIRLPPDIHISGTPTILLAGSDGTVKSQFVGKLSADREKDLVRTVQELCRDCGFNLTL